VAHGKRCEHIRTCDNTSVNLNNRTRREMVQFNQAFRIAGIDRQMPAGSYEVIKDEELIEGLSFASYRVVSTMMMVPAAPPHANSTEMILIGNADLAEAQRKDASTTGE